MKTSDFKVNTKIICQRWLCACFLKHKELHGITHYVLEIYEKKPCK